MSRAAPDLMDLIHGLVADSLKQELQRAFDARDENDNPIPINPQLLDKAMKFLKDNGIDAPAANKKVDLLADQLSKLNVDVDQEAALRH
jgi:hypothetical protein